MNYADTVMKSSKLKKWAVGFAVGNEGKATLEGRRGCVVMCLRERVWS